MPQQKKKSRRKQRRAQLESSSQKINETTGTPAKQGLKNKERPLKLGVPAELKTEWWTWISFTMFFWFFELMKFFYIFYILYTFFSSLYSGKNMKTHWWQKRLHIESGWRTTSLRQQQSFSFFPSLLPPFPLTPAMQLNTLKTEYKKKKKKTPQLLLWFGDLRSTKSAVAIYLWWEVFLHRNVPKAPEKCEKWAESRNEPFLDTALGLHITYGHMPWRAVP